MRLARLYPIYADWIAVTLSFAIPHRHKDMTSINCHISISLDGFVAGPGQSPENPIGRGGLRLHEWVFATQSWHAQHGQEGGQANVDSEVAATASSGVGAYIMGRNMFGPGRGQWDPGWHGWWGDDPPYHTPVYVLSHHARATLPMAGGTVFHFVTDGIESALEQARTAAAGGDVSIAGGARTVQQYLRAGLLDELFLHVVPIVLGSGERLLEDVGDPRLTPTEVIASPSVTHIRYRVG
jgi:dihydrofolate reductase